MKKEIKIAQRESRDSKIKTNDLNCSSKEKRKERHMLEGRKEEAKLKSRHESNLCRTQRGCSWSKGNSSFSAQKKIQPCRSFLQRLSDSSEFYQFIFLYTFAQKLSFKNSGEGLQLVSGQEFSSDDSTNSYSTVQPFLGTQEVRRRHFLRYEPPFRVGEEKNWNVLFSGITEQKRERTAPKL